MTTPTRTTTDYFASGTWEVVDGSAEEFVRRWTEFLAWTRDEHPAFRSARLIRDLRRPNHFVSFAAWTDPAALAAWREEPGFAERFGRCRELCASMSGSGYALVAAI
ncbi:putative quinol monooxygenase [Kitasatospora sp. NPDC127111]|uniref:putative quinol monooxygenase n=1 Tax=Kitasatospora sp. NPDC127111 TaxID=3345363 RepID=UPI003625C01E